MKQPTFSIGVRRRQVGLTGQCDLTSCYCLWRQI